ncbi:hypothetical protein GCM10010991_25270 [Gemmobacter aquaticus]|uniref:Uncharacterized protein n=1 Tax=Gemmobacter aquaticus TaxID=490185 RepID=A0A917YN90_9RHOB|nr:hypothetical protein GCM10010991_25270 [Gemmobacter aquaticus]
MAVRGGLKGDQRGTRLWLIKKVKRAFREAMPGQNYRINPMAGVGLAVDVEGAGRLHLSMEAVTDASPRQTGRLDRVISTLKSLIGLPSEQSHAKPVLLLLYEDPADLPALRQLVPKIAGRSVKLQTAAALLEPAFASKLERALRGGKVHDCMLVARSREGPSSSLARAIERLVHLFSETKRLRQACLAPDGRLALIAWTAPAPVEDQQPSNHPGDDKPEASGSGPDPGG